MSSRRSHGSALSSLAAVFGAGLAALFLTGCPPMGSCEHEGKTYHHGDSFKDDCNTCTCSESGVACTLIACGTPADCRRTGCSGQLCSDHDMVTTCEWRNEYACYQSATCERQPSGTCGFTSTTALTQCLAGGGPPASDGGSGQDAGAPSQPDAGAPKDAGGGNDAGSGGCYRGGCSGQLCTEDPAALSTCEWRSEYACYQTATCERQANGKCGYTQTDALAMCLKGGKTDAGTTPEVSPPGDGGVCDFQDRYEYGAIGGFVAYSDRSYLSPGNKYRHVRTPVRGAQLPSEISCEPAMPPCNHAYEVTAYYVENMLVKPDVQAALAEPTPPLFGYDARPVDGSVFEFKSSKGSFLVGGECNGRDARDCRAIPAGIRALVSQLIQLDKERLATDVCKAAGFTQ